MIRRNGRHDRGPDGVRHRGVHKNGVDHVREERNGEVLEHTLDESVPREDLHRHESDRDRHDEPRDPCADDDPRRISDRTEIGSDVHDVGDDDERDRRVKHPPRVMLLEYPGEAAAGDLAKPRADVLDRCHERKGDERGPEGRKTERRSGHRVRPDPTGIVVGRAGDESRPKNERGLFDRLTLARDLLRSGHPASFFGSPCLCRQKSAHGSLPARRFSKVRMLKVAGSRRGETSSHASGVEIAACGLFRTL